MDKEKCYKKIIADAESFYKSENPMRKNIKVGEKTFDMLWCPGLKNEINLWSYWQGKGNLDTAKILVVGKDYGGYGAESELNKLATACIDSDDSDKFDISRKYIEEIYKNKNETDNNLIKLFNALSDECGQDLRADKPNDNLFFTNLCLGYRSIPDLTGGVLSALFAHDVAYLKVLLQLLQPKVMILLGQDVGISVIEGLVDLADPRNSAIKHIYSGIKSSLNRALDRSENHIQLQMDGNLIDTFVVSHPGYFGSTVNRKGGYEKVEEDWRKIAAYIK
ncbi:hypothetical protein [Butyrivibrio sp. AC2005]|uniref:hypothetical protein n=1 Tax=Butyrivibrio sp. AC2005 TaxID=1280672 RepID=UPI0004228F2F|nr:hypothetical protein [Butyrivibrio sp. AC2005]